MDYAQYIAKAGAVCPVCGSDQIEGGSLEVDGNLVWQHIHCQLCASAWTDQYHLTAVTDVQIGTPAFALWLQIEGPAAAAEGSDTWGCDRLAQSWESKSLLELHAKICAYLKAIAESLPVICDPLDAAAVAAEAAGPQARLALAVEEYVAATDEYHESAHQVLFAGPEAAVARLGHHLLQTFGLLNDPDIASDMERAAAVAAEPMVTTTAAPPAAPAKKRLVVVVEGGVVTGVVADEEMAYVTLDYDTEGADLEDLVEVAQEPGVFADACIWYGAEVADADPAWVTCAFERDFTGSPGRVVQKAVAA